jgi:Flp pilus assembly protein TadG
MNKSKWNNTNNGSKTRSRENGQTLVEMAMTVVFLMVLFSVVVDLGRIFFTYVALRDASQEGAAYAALDPFDTIAVEARVRNSSTTPIDLSSTTNISVTVATSGGGCVGDTVTVGVNYGAYPLITPFTGAFINSQTVFLSASEINTILQSSC